MEIFWEHEVATLLGDLSAVQDDLLALLAEKRGYLLASDTVALLSLQPREQALVMRLQTCHDRRASLLKQAAADGLPATNLKSLVGAIDSPHRRDIQRQIQQSAQRAHLLQHQSLTQWVQVQRTLLHLSQLLEIIATGGQTRPTYSKEDPDGATGTLVDRAA